MFYDTEEKVTLGFKHVMRNLVNFNASSGRSKNLNFDVLLLLKYIMFETKMYRGVMYHNTEE